MFYARIIYKDTELLRTNNFDLLSELTDNINSLFMGYETDCEVFIKIFKDHYEEGYYQLDFDGQFVPLNDKNEIIEEEF